MIWHELLIGLPWHCLQMIIHGFVFNEDTKPAHENHLQTTPTLLQASFLSIMTMTVTYNLLHLTRTVGVKSLSRYLQYATLIDSESPINLKHQTISATVGRRKHPAARDGANTAPYQSCHRDNFLPTTRIGIRMAAPGNAFSLNRRAVMCKASAK